MIYSSILYLILLIVFGVFCLLKKKTNINFKIIFYVLEGILFTSMFVKCFMHDSFIYVINDGELYGVYSNNTDIKESFIRWVMMFSQIIFLNLAINNNKFNKILSAYICLPLVFISSLFFDNSLSYFLNYEHVLAFRFPNVLTIIILYLEMLSSLLIPITLLFYNKDELKIEQKHDYAVLVKLGIFSLLTCIPFLFYPSLFGQSEIQIKFMNTTHIMWIVSIALIYCLFYFCFQNEDISIRESILTVLILYLFFHFNSCFKVGLTLWRLPFQLCNLASYLFVIIMVCKKQSLFNFLFVANPVGALIAIITLSETGPIFKYWIIHYLIEHLWVFIIPLLFISFKIFKIPNIKQLTKSYFIWFSIYYFSMLFLNVFINGVLVPNFGSTIINSVNYFYLLDCPVKDVLPFYKDLMIGHIKIFNVDLYIVYLLFIYVVFTALCYLLYFIQVLFFKLAIYLKNQSAKILFHKQH
ncbi:MAG: YwaF family protein [Bacillales bacterium]|nr:YwaF family protein [Bacillales bacterium]